MIFGDHRHFAIEVCVDRPWTEDLPDQACGRMRMWFVGETVGDFDEPHCVLGAFADKLREAVVKWPKAWHPALAALAPGDRFDLLDLCGCVRAIPTCTKCAWTPRSSVA